MEEQVSIGRRGEQVRKAHYTNLRYMGLVRCITHWHQVNAVDQCCKKGARVLEIGPGTGHSTWLMRKIGIDVTTLDISEDLEPDCIGDITSLAFEENAFDCIIAAEVLEHLPYSDFSRALHELARVSRDRVIITLPAPLVGLSTLINLPKLVPKNLSIGFPYWREHRFDGEHYWELGKRGYQKSRIRSAIEDAGLRIVREFRPAPSLFSYFFECAKVRL